MSSASGASERKRVISSRGRPASRTLPSAVECAGRSAPTVNGGIDVLSRPERASTQTGRPSHTATWTVSP